MSTMTEVAAPPALTAHDRCDRCGAQAVVRTVMRSGLDLLWCGHHSREYAAALAAQEAQVL